MDLKNYLQFLLKGKELPVQIYSLKNKRQKLRKKKTGFNSVLIGRSNELQFLNSAISVLQQNKGAVVSIIGEAGIGKSRLLKEFRVLFEDKVKWFEGRALSHLVHISYVPAKEILKKLISDNAEENGPALKIALKHQLVRLDPLKGDELFPFLISLLELPITEEEAIVMRYLDAATLRDKLQNAFVHFVQLHLKMHPFLFVWEDLHWADEATLQLLARMLELSREEPLINILLFRPEKNANIWDLHLKLAGLDNFFYKYIELDPLTKSENSALIWNLFKIKEGIPEVEQLVFDKSGGNPFYIEELLRTLVVQGIIHVKDEQVQYSGSLKNIKLPNTVQGIIASRVDQLGSEAKFVLQTASVLGRIFNKTLLQRLLSATNKKVDFESAVEKLTDNEMLRIKEGKGNGDEKVELIFKHAITQEVAYNTMLISLRKEIHTQAAGIINHLFGEEQSFVIAYHFEKASKHKEAVQFYRIAATNAEKVFAYENALTFYFKAIEQAGLLMANVKEPFAPEPLSELYEKVGDICRLQTRREEALHNYRSALTYVKETDWVAKARNLRKQSLCYESIRVLSAHTIVDLQKEAGQLLEHEEIRTPDWWNEWLELQFDIYWSLYNQARPNEMEKLINDIKTPVELHASPIQKTRYLGCVLLYNFRTCAFQLTEKTIEIARQAVESSAAISDLQVVLLSRFELAFTYLWANRIELAISHFEDFLADAELIGDKVVASRGMIYLIVAYRRQGNVAKTEELTKTYLTTDPFVRISIYEPFISANNTWVCWKKRKFDEIEINYSVTVEKWTNSMPFRFLYAMPMLAYSFEMKDIGKCIECIREMNLPPQRKLEPDLASYMQQVQNNFNEQKTEEVSSGIEAILKLAEQYKYL